MNYRVIVYLLCASVAANAELTFKEIRTASKDILVAYFQSTVINANEVNTTNLASWKLNGQPVTAVGTHQLTISLPALTRAAVAVVTFM